MSSTVIRRRVVVAGRVQGVFFRDACRKVARERGLQGWVRNRPEGTVEAVFEGEPDAVDAAVGWARSGPEDASVTSVEIIDEQPEGLNGFVVR